MVMLVGQVGHAGADWVITDSVDRIIRTDLSLWAVGSLGLRRRHYDGRTFGQWRTNALKHDLPILNFAPVPGRTRILATSNHLKIESSPPCTQKSMSLSTFASTRLIRIMVRKLVTKESVVAEPTPSAPGRQEKPL